MSIFDEKSKIYGSNPTVDLQVLIYRRPNLRDENLEFELYMGRHVLKGIFDEMKMMPDVKDLFLSFPENCLNIIEQRVLFQRLEHYCPNLKKLTIKTHSVYIIQCTPNGKAMIVGSEEEFANPLPSESDNTSGDVNLTDKLYTKMVKNVFNANGLTVLGG